jgi:hypothetical protein
MQITNLAFYPVATGQELLFVGSETFLVQEEVEKFSI